MKPYGQVGIIRNIRDFTSWAQHVTNLRNLEDVSAYDRLYDRVAVLEGAPSGGGSWGSISGTLSAQTDLQSALDGKQASGSYVTTAGLSELVDDRVAALLVAGSNVTLTYDDGLGTLTIAASGGSGNSYFPSGW